MSEDLKKMEKEEISKEIISEWYKEKGVETEKSEILVEKKEEKKEPSPPSFSVPRKDKDNLKKEEEEKKLLIKGKIKELLALAETKGLERSIKEARKQNNPFLLDIYHDVLAKDAAYKRFLSG